MNGTATAADDVRKQKTTIVAFMRISKEEKEKL